MCALIGQFSGPYFDVWPTNFKSFFELKSWTRYFFVLSRAWDKVKILSSRQESSLRPSDSALQCSTTEPQKVYGE